MFHFRQHSLNRARRVLVGLAVFGWLVSSAAMAGVFVVSHSSVAQGTATEIVIGGFPNETFRISYVDNNGVAQTATATTQLVPLSSLSVAKLNVPAKKGTEIIVKNLTQPAEDPESVVAQRFSPDTETGVTAFAIDPGSSLTAFGLQFALAGGFTALTTSAQYDPNAPGYGTLSGTLPSSLFSVFATAGAERIDLVLDPIGALFAIDAASAWTADTTNFPASVPFNQQLAGTLYYHGLGSPFMGTLAGEVSYMSENFEVLTGTFALDGIGAGSFSARGQTQFVSEPPIWPMALFGFALVLACGFARHRSSTTQ